MSGFDSLLERVRESYARIAELEAIVARSPKNEFRLIELSSVKRFAEQLEEEWYEHASHQQIEICRYRLVSEEENNYPAAAFSSSLLNFQSLFSQVYDAKKNGPKHRARISGEIISDTSFQFGFTYPGSLGVVLTIPGESMLFGDKYDEAVTSFLGILDIRDEKDIRELINELGDAVVSRTYDWSKANYFGGFGVDVGWRDTSGTQKNGMIKKPALGKIVEIIDRTSDKEVRKFKTDGVLIGIDAKTNKYRFIEPSGEDYFGPISDHLDMTKEWAINTQYTAIIEVEAITRYATQETKQTYRLIELKSQ